MNLESKNQLEQSHSSNSFVMLLTSSIYDSLLSHQLVDGIVCLPKIAMAHCFEGQNCSDEEFFVPFSHVKMLDFRLAPCANECLKGQIEA